LTSSPAGKWLPSRGSTGRVTDGPWDEMRFDLNPGKRRSIDALGRGNRRCRAMTWWFLWLK